MDGRKCECLEFSTMKHYFSEGTVHIERNFVGYSLGYVLLQMGHNCLIIPNVLPTIESECLRRFCTCFTVVTNNF